VSHDPVPLKRSEVRADPVVREAKGLGEFLDCAARATQQRDDSPARALEEFLVPVRSQCSLFLCQLILTVVSEDNLWLRIILSNKSNKSLIYC
jgi:hypothetical protein